MSRMRLLLATPLYPPEAGGPATYAQLLVQELSKEGIEVELLRFSDVRHLPNVLRQIAYAYKVLVRGSQVDTILALDALSVGWPCFVANLFLRKRFVVKIVGDHVWEQGRQRFGITDSLDSFTHSNKPLHPYLAFLKTLRDIVAKSADTIIVPSNYLATVVEVWGVDAKRISSVRNAVSVTSIGAVPASVTALTKPLVVSVGRLVPWKGMEGIISAVVALRASGRSVSLAIVGDGPQEKVLQRLSEEKLVDGYVFTGKLSHEDTLAVIQAADLFVLNSSYEGLSHLLLEAVALGTPAIASTAGGNAEVLPSNRLFTVGSQSGLETMLGAALGESRTVPQGGDVTRMIGETTRILFP